MSDDTRLQDTEFDPRHRVVGAIILVLIGVIFLPMLLERDADDTGAVTGNGIEQEQAVEEKVFVSTITPVVEGAEDGATPAQPVPAPTSTPSKPVPVPAPQPETEAKPQPKPAPAPPQPKTPPAPATTSEQTGETWLVRIGTFSQTENAQRVIDDLKAKGFKPETGAIATSKGKAMRVWLGPFPDRDHAVSQRSRILKETGYEGLVVPAP